MSKELTESFLEQSGIRLKNVWIPGRLMLAPMAGFTDVPYRKICRRLGASYAVGEMVASKKELRGTTKSAGRFRFEDEPAPRGLQLLGADPASLADAARFAVDHGAQVIDLNCGCPAKKVCSVECGSALLQNEKLIGELLKALRKAVDVPLTLKYRTGWDPEHRNAESVAKIAEAEGVDMLVLHGRTRAEGFAGHAEYETIRRVKQSVLIPVIANGDIVDAQSALDVLAYTKADGLMIGRGALGNPWIFERINAVLEGRSYTEPGALQVCDVIVSHLRDHVDFYGSPSALKTIRKHLIWYFKRLDLCPEKLEGFFKLTSPEGLEEQLKNFLLSAPEPLQTQ